jgi:AhpC/TSA antioxidant enzyme
LRQQQRFFESKGVQIVAVGMGAPGQAQEFKKSRNISFPLLSDTSQRSYNAYGLGRFSFAAELSGNSLGAMFQQATKGHFAGIPVGDITQLGGTFLIDQSGIARFVHRDRTTSDFPTVSSLQKVVTDFAGS